MNFRQEDQFFMKEALQLAKKGMSWTNPNPMVGAVIVRGGKIIGRGYHKRIGLPHAEIEAFNNTKINVKGATLYVNLEPCRHFGRTPPCVDAIIKAGIKRVVCATPDPNPKVKEKGIAMLQRAGIEVSVGLLKEEAKLLNETFFTFHEKERPFVAIKFAASLDGKIATRTDDSKWVTNEQARTYARKLRSHYQAILVGINTVLKDDPHLGTRIKGKKDPIRIVLDSTLKIPLTSQVLRDTNVLIATTTKANKEKLKILTDKGIPVIVFNTTSITLPDLLKEFKKRKIISVLVEGGGQILGSFVDAKLVDKVYAFHAPILIGGEKGVSAIGGKGALTISDALRLEQVSVKHFGVTTLTVGNVK